MTFWFSSLVSTWKTKAAEVKLQAMNMNEKIRQEIESSMKSYRDRLSHLEKSKNDTIKDLEAKFERLSKDKQGIQDALRLRESDMSALRFDPDFSGTLFLF